MAITKTKTLIEVRYAPSSGNDMVSAMPMQDIVTGTYNFSIDDPDDNELPIITTKHFTITRDDDFSQHDLIVQTICNAVWEEVTPEAE